MLNEAVVLGFDREKALKDIDTCLDDEFEYENRKDIGLNEEKIPDQLYDDILLGFKIEKEENEN